MRPAGATWPLVGAARCRTPGSAAALGDEVPRHFRRCGFQPRPWRERCALRAEKLWEGGGRGGAVQERGFPFQGRKTPICPMPPLTLRRCGPSASSTALQCAQRRMPRMLGIRRYAHGEAFFRFWETKGWENAMQDCANDPLDGMGEMSIVRAATEVPGTGRPSLSALWDAMGLAIGKLCRSVSAGIGQIGVLPPFPMRPHFLKPLWWITTMGLGRWGCIQGMGRAQAFAPLRERGVSCRPPCSLHPQNHRSASTI